MRRQNVAQWVNLQLLLFRCHKDSPFPQDTFQHPFSPLSPRPELLLTCTISQLFQAASPRQPSDAFARQGIVSLTPCVLCLHHFSGQILPRRATICSAGRIFNYFSRPCHLGVCNKTFSDDIFQRCQLKSLKLFIFTVL